MEVLQLDCVIAVTKGNTVLPVVIDFAITDIEFVTTGPLLLLTDPDGRLCCVFL
jgi:hypothetical protein